MSNFARVLFLIFLFSPPASYALVDMRNANYSDSWVDLETKSQVGELKLQRSYNSRTLYSGMFGFGWCTPYETTLKVTAENTLRITECGAGYEVDYLPANYSKDNLEKNIKAIMAEVKKRNPSRDARYFKDLEKDIRLDSTLRDEFTKQLNITGKIQANSRYEANGRATDYVVFNGAEYVRNMSNGAIQKFDKEGRMVYASDKNSNFIKVSYAGDKVIRVVDNSGSSLQFKYYDNSKFVKQVVGPRGLSATYKYKGENLTQVYNAWKNTYKYEYDDLNNLTRATYPDNTFIALTYNKDKDWVTSFRDRRGCKEAYAYKDNEKDPLNNYTSAVEKICDGKVTNKSSYEFWHKTRKDGSRYLSRTKAVNNGSVTDTYYHEQFGRPITIIQNGVTTKFGYYDNGLLKSKSDGANSYSYAYDKSCSKVSQVVAKTVFFRAPATGSKGKVNAQKKETRTVTSQFLYEPKRCNLITAKNSFGQSAQMNYDMRGRITKIVDQSKKEVLITYEERFGKPHRVTRPGLGTIEFKYKADGSMAAFDSKEDPLIAVQVASIFSNLLEIIAPATTDANSI